SHLNLPSGTRTGVDGTFRLKGIGPECMAHLRFEGPTIETAEVYAMTRPGTTINLPADKELLGSCAEVFHACKFDHVAAPTRLIEGVVRDKDTGKPLAGVTIQTDNPKNGIDLRTTTDEKGRYRLVGLSPEAKHWLMAVPAPGQPYLRAALTSPAGPGLKP